MAEDRTYTKYYTDNNTDKLPDSVRGDVLRGQFSSGFHGTRLLQRTLGLTEDKKIQITNDIVTAAENYNGDLHNAYLTNLQEFYKSIAPAGSKNQKFLKGWMNGVKLMRENGCHVVPKKPLTR